MKFKIIDKKKICLEFSDEDIKMINENKTYEIPIKEEDEFIKGLASAIVTIHKTMEKMMIERGIDTLVGE